MPELILKHLGEYHIAKAIVKMDLICTIPLISLEPWNSFSKVVWSTSLKEPLTKKEITTAIRNKDYQTKPLPEEQIWKNKVNTRKSHIKRIAFLVVYPDFKPIDIDVGVPSLGCYVSWIVQDGNHRLAAAFYRGDKTIQALITGSLDHARELLPGILIPEFV